jgi:chromosome segregation ATPase
LIEEKNLVDNKFYSLTASYRQLDDTNKNLHNQLQLIKLNLEKVESENQGSLIKLNQLNDDFNSEIQKKKLLQEDLNILREKFKDIEKENQRLTNKLYDFESKIESNKSQVKNKEIEYSDLDREKQYISEQLKSVRKELEEYKQSSKNVQDYLKELEIKDRLSEDKIDKLSTQLRQVKELYEKEKALLQEKESIIKKGIAQYEQLQLEKNWLEKKLEKSFVSPIQSTSLEKDDSEILKAELKKTSEELENQKKQNLSLELLQNQTSKDFDILKQQTELAKSTLKTVFMMLGQPQEEDDLTKLSSNLYSVIIPLLSNLKK